eukprot:183060-Amphidinium_carterae.1
MMAWKKVSAKGLPLRLASWDVSRAHLYGEVKRTVWCKLPEGDDEPGMVARLLKSVYGLQEASHIWQAHWGRLLQKAGRVRGTANPACMHCKSADASGVVHGDDFLILGDHLAIQEMSRLLEGEYEVKMTGCITLSLRGMPIRGHPRVPTHRHPESCNTYT